MQQVSCHAGVNSYQVVARLGEDVRIDTRSRSRPHFQA
jgi:hypothetical protein